MKGRRPAIARLSLALLLAASACHHAHQVVVIDGWWNADYAWNASQRAKSNLAGDAELIEHSALDEQVHDLGRRDVVGEHDVETRGSVLCWTANLRARR